jgi:hypothetical protein
MMRMWLPLAAAAALCAGTSEVLWNANSRYTVESVAVPAADGRPLSAGLQRDLDRLTGRKLDSGLLDRFARRIEQELRSGVVAPRVERGSAPGFVSVVFRMERPAEHGVELEAPRFFFHSRQGFTGLAEARIRRGPNLVRFGVGSDNNERIERFDGVTVDYERPLAGGLALRVAGGSYQTAWAAATRTATPALYHSRHSFAPSILLRLAAPLTLEVGTRFQAFGGARAGTGTELANAVTSTLRLEQRWRDAAGRTLDLRAAYGFAGAGAALRSGYRYTRQSIDARAAFAPGADHKLEVAFHGGAIAGRAPLAERFLLGNANLLRGANKLDLTPAGADKLAAGSVEYRFKGWMLFWDCGSAWDSAAAPEVVHTAGFGYRKGSFQAALALPLAGAPAGITLIVGFSY